MENPSIKIFLLAPTFLLLQKSVSHSGLGSIPWVWRWTKGCGGYQDPQEWAQSSLRIREVLSPQAPLLMSSTELGWGQQQADLSFLEPQHVVSQPRGWTRGEGICSFQHSPPLSPRGAQILLTHQSNHVTLDLGAYWIQGIQSQPEPVRKLSAEQSSWLEAKADKEEPSSSDISAWRNMLNRPCT